MKVYLHGPALKLTLLGAVLVALPACSRQGPPAKPATFGQISGKVTFDDEPVIYGYVLLYPFGNEADGKGGLVSPVGFGHIKDGAYEIPAAPAGLMKLCVATNPDLSEMELKEPVKVGVGNKDKKQDPTKGLDKKGVKKKDKEGKGDKGDKVDWNDKKPALKDFKPPKKPLDPTAKPPMPNINPLALKLTADQKKTLREIHAAYGDYAKTPLTYPVREGEQTHDLILGRPEKK